MAVSQIEKSTLDAVKYYFTQKRSYQEEPAPAARAAIDGGTKSFSLGDRTPARPVTSYKDLLDSDCEACT
jgi:hypothetical protein